jgi:hypothetical protein
MKPQRLFVLLGSVALALATLTGMAAPATAASTPPPSQRPHPKGTPSPKRPHPRLNQALAPGVNLLSIQTSPSVPGAKFTFAGVTVTADSAGVASMQISPAQRQLLRQNRAGELQVTTPTVDVRQGVRAQFSGWYKDGDYRAGVESQIATFEFEYLTSFNFTNPKGRAVSPALLTSMQLQSSVGEIIDLDSADPLWLQGSQMDGLDSKEIFYKVNSVVVAGSNVVNSAQQRLYPAQQSVNTLTLLFFSARFVATDAMFGGGIGKGIELTYPDGSVREFSFGKAHAVTVDDLPRGDYHVTVVGGGLRMARPVSISRTQEADLDVISYLDVAVVGVAMAILALAILWLGLQLRRRHHGYSRRMARQARRDRKAEKRQAVAGTAAVQQP